MPEFQQLLFFFSLVFKKKIIFLMRKILAQLFQLAWNLICGALPKGADPHPHRGRQADGVRFCTLCSCKPASKNTGFIFWISPETQNLQHVTISLTLSLYRSCYKGRHVPLRMPWKNSAFFWHTARTSEEVNGIPASLLAACKVPTPDRLSEENLIS